MICLKTKILYKISKAIVDKYHPDIIGIANSHGGSSTKEAVFAVLSKKFKVRENDGIYPSEVEIPLTIIGYKNKKYSFLEWCGIVFKGLGLLVNKQSDYPDIVVLDIKITNTEEMNFITKYLQFRFGVIGFSDLVFESSIKNTKKIIEIQQVLVRSLSDSGVAVLNQDNKALASMRSKAKKMTFGFDEKADIYASEPVYTSSVYLGSEDGQGTRFKLHYKGSAVPIFIPNGLGIYHVYSALSAINIGLVYQMNLTEISSSLMKYNVPAGRMKLISGIKKSIIIDDTYNSFPLKAKKAIKVLSEVSCVKNCRKLAVLGDMIGLGVSTQMVHREIGYYLVEQGIDILFTVGEMSTDIAQAAKEAGMPENNIFSFSDIKSAGKFIQKRLKESDVILIKGSSSLRMERVVKEIMAEPLKAKKMLVKRSVNLINQ